MSNADAESSQTNYPTPPVRIFVDEPARSDRDRGLRILNTVEVADEIARSAANAKDAEVNAAPPPALPIVAPAPYTGAVLLEAANVVRAIRERLTQLGDRLASLSEKSDDLEKLKAAVEEAREQRASQLETALLAGKKANTAQVDQRCAAAVAALEKRRDEVIAVERALSTLRAQQDDARATLLQCEETYQKARDEHLQEIKWAGSRSEEYLDAIAKARACLLEMEMSPHFRERLISAKADPAGSDQLPSASAIRELVTLQASADLTTAAELAAIPAPPLPQGLGFVWANGSIHQEPETKPDLHPEPLVGIVSSETFGITSQP
jgi:hypothetical protein